MTSLVKNRGILAVVLFGTLLLASCEQKNDPISQKAKALLPRVKTLSRDITVYHWAKRDSIGFAIGKVPNPSDPDVLGYAQGLAKSLYGTQTYGTGLYAAIDPFITKGIGGKDPALLVLHLRKGMRFLDIRPGPSEFAAIRDEALDRKLGIAGTIYDYGAFFQLEGCEEQSTSAFRIGDLSSANTDPRLYVLDSVYPESDLTERLRIDTLFQIVPKVGYLWPNLADREAALDGQPQWVHQNVFGCDPAFYPEDLAPADYADVTEATFVERFQDLQSQAGPRNPLRFKDLIARRFINRPDWQAYVDSRRGQAHTKINPAEVYDPKPTTWENWLKIADRVDQAAREKTPLTQEMLLDWNQGAILNTVPDYVEGGVLKSTPNYGANLDRASALRADEIQPLLDFKFEGDPRPALRWEPLLCAEDLPKNLKLPIDTPDCREVARDAGRLAARDSFWKQTKVNLEGGKLYEGTTYHTEWYWYACWPRVSHSEAQKESLRNHQTLCGMIIYPEPQTVKDRLAKILTSVRDHFTESAPSGNIEFALKIQRELVALHPFNKGNGRISRWVMDYITTRAGLPPILVQDMNKDLSTEESVYLEQGRMGIAQSLAIMKRCLKHPLSPDSECGEI